MGLGDFWLQFNNGKKEQLSDIRGDIRRETVDKKYHNIFDFFDKNKNGAIEGKEAEEFIDIITKFAGDKTLTSKEVSSLFTQLGIENPENIDFVDFVKNISDVNKKIKNTEESILPDGSRKVVTDYEGGARLTAVYYPDGDLKYTIREISASGTRTLNNTSYTNQGREIGVANSDNSIDAGFQSRQRKAEFSERAKSELRLSFGEHFQEVADNILYMTNAFLNDMTIWDRSGVDMHKAVIDGDLTELFTADGVKRLEELKQKAEENSKTGHALTEMAVNKPGSFDFYAEKLFGLKDFDFEKIENFHQTKTKYLNAKSLKQRVELLNKGLKEVKQLYENAKMQRRSSKYTELLDSDFDKKYADTLKDLENNYEQKCIEVLKEFFDGDEGVAKAFLKSMKEGLTLTSDEEIENNDIYSEIIDRISKATEKQLSEVLQGEKFENLENRYKAEFKDIYGKEDDTAEVENIIQTGQAIGGTVKIGTLTAVQIVLGAITAGTGNAALIGIISNPLVGYLTTVGTDYALSVAGALSSLNGLTSEKHGQIIEGTGEMAKFVGVGTLSAPLCRFVGQTLSKYTGKLFDTGIKTTKGAVTEITISGDNLLQNICQKSANFAGSFGTEIGVFTGYEIITQDEDFDEALGSQSSMLTQLKVVNKFLQTVLGKFVYSQNMKGQQKLAQAEYNKFLKETGLDKAKITKHETPTGTRYTGEFNGQQYTGATEEEIQGKLLTAAAMQYEVVNKGVGVNKGVNNEGVVNKNSRVEDESKTPEIDTQKTENIKPEVAEIKTVDDFVQYLKENHISFKYIKDGDNLIIRISDDTKPWDKNRFDYYIFENGELKEKRIQTDENELGKQNWKQHTGRSRSLNSGINPEPLVEGMEAHNAAKNLKEIQTVNEINTDAIQNKISELKQKYPVVHEAEYTLENGEKVTFQIFTESQDGGNTGFYALNKNSGLLYYIKYAKNPAAEALAADLYRLAGINVPEVSTISLGKNYTAVLSKYIPDLTVIGRGNSLVNMGFGMDALLANWDAVQSNNAMTDGVSAIRIDVGCCFDYRSHGQPKQYNENVSELYSLLDPKYKASAEIFSTMTREDCIASLKNVAGINLDKAKELFIARNQLNYFDVFKARIDFISRVCQEMEQTPQNNLTMFEYMKSIVEKVSKEMSLEKNDSHIININELNNKKQQLMAQLSTASKYEDFEIICNAINEMPYSTAKLDLIEEFNNKYSIWKQNPEGIVGNQIIEDYTVDSVNELKISSRYRSQVKHKGHVVIEEEKSITTIDKVNGGYRVVTKTKEVAPKPISVEKRKAWINTLETYCGSPLYDKINKALEALDRNEPISDEMRILIKNLEELIGNQPPSKAGMNLKVYRTERSHWAIEELEKITGTNLKNIKEGEVIPLNAEIRQSHFMSTSKRSDGGYAIVGLNMEAKVRYELEVGEGCKMIDIIDYLGVDYFEENEKFASKFMKDAEILFQHGTKIKVSSVEKDNSGCFVIKGSVVPVLTIGRD